jgi:hypothetical protein
VIIKGALGKTDGAPHLKPGDVLMVSKKVQPRDGGAEYWWKTFRLVLGPVRFDRSVDTLLCKLHPDPDKDWLTIDFSDTYVVEYLEEHRWPQGVVAMRMKAIHMGHVQLAD